MLNVYSSEVDEEYIQEFANNYVAFKRVLTESPELIMYFFGQSAFTMNVEIKDVLANAIIRKNMIRHLGNLHVWKVLIRDFHKNLDICNFINIYENIAVDFLTELVQEMPEFMSQIVQKSRDRLGVVFFILHSFGEDSLEYSFICHMASANITANHFSILASLIIKNTGLSQDILDSVKKYFHTNEYVIAVADSFKDSIDKEINEKSWVEFLENMQQQNFNQQRFI